MNMNKNMYKNMNKNMTKNHRKGQNIQVKKKKKMSRTEISLIGNKFVQCHYHGNYRDFYDALTV